MSYLDQDAPLRQPTAMPEEEVMRRALIRTATVLHKFLDCVGFPTKDRAHYRWARLPAFTDVQEAAEANNANAELLCTPEHLKPKVDEATAEPSDAGLVERVARALARHVDGHEACWQDYEPEAEAALSVLPRSDGGEDAVQAETYRQMHEDAKELGYPSILEALEDVERLRAEVEIFDWLAANSNLELIWQEIDNDPSECAWTVHRRQGGYNDREWTLIAYGETPLEALTEARAALKGGE